MFSLHFAERCVYEYVRRNMFVWIILKMYKYTIYIGGGGWMCAHNPKGNVNDELRFVAKQDANSFTPSVSGPQPPLSYANLNYMNVFVSCIYSCFRCGTESF